MMEDDTTFEFLSDPETGEPGVRVRHANGRSELAPRVD